MFANSILNATFMFYPLTQRTGKYSDKNRYNEWTPALKTACNWRADSDDGLFWMSAADFVKNVNRVQYARSFGVAWKKVTQWHHFATGELTATANQDFKPKPKEEDEIPLKKGETIKILRISAGKGWRQGANASGAEGYIRSRMLDVDPNRACARHVSAPRGAAPRG